MQIPQSQPLRIHPAWCETHPAVTIATKTQSISQQQLRVNNPKQQKQQQLLLLVKLASSEMTVTVSSTKTDCPKGCGRGRRQRERKGEGSTLKTGISRGWSSCIGSSGTSVSGSGTSRRRSPPPLKARCVIHLLGCVDSTTRDSQVPPRLLLL